MMPDWLYHSILSAIAGLWFTALGWGFYEWIQKL